jgi:hypothetical protein
MKKYLYAFIPLAVCLGLAFFIGNLKPTDYPDITYPYRTPAALEGLSSLYVFVGVVLSVLMIICLVIYDIFKAIEKKSGKNY